MSQGVLGKSLRTLPGTLWSRRVPQVLATYAASCWGILQFVDWLTDRYQLSPVLTDFWAYLGVLAAPSVLLLAYFRSEPGRTPWTGWEKFGIPLNALLAALVLFVVFRGQELGAVNEVITVRDSSGRLVQRLVPKRAFLDTPQP